MLDIMHAQTGTNMIKLIAPPPPLIFFSLPFRPPFKIFLNEALIGV